MSLAVESSHELRTCRKSLACQVDVCSEVNHTVRLSHCNVSSADHVHELLGITDFLRERRFCKSSDGDDVGVIRINTAGNELDSYVVFRLALDLVHGAGCLIKLDGCPGSC